MPGSFKRKYKLCQEVTNGSNVNYARKHLPGHVRETLDSPEIRSALKPKNNILESVKFFFLAKYITNKEQCKYKSIFDPKMMK